MKKSYTVSSTRIDDGDVVVRYMVHKKVEKPMDTTGLVTSIVDYVQNREVYFGFGPQFHDGVLLFSIVGFPHDHEEVQQVLRDRIESHECVLKILPYEKEGV